MDFEVDGACRTSFDAFSAPVHKASEACRSACHREIRFGVVENLELGARLPLGDLQLQPTAKSFGMKRAAVEENGVHARPASEKVREVACNGAVGRIRKCPFSEPRLGSGRTIIQIAFGKEPVENDRLDLCAMDARGERLAQEARSLGGN